MTADGTGVISQARGLLLTRMRRATGLDGGLEVALKRWRPPWAVHDPVKIVTDLAVALALGGDCLADATILRGGAGAVSGRCPPTRWSPGRSRGWPAMRRGR